MIIALKHDAYVKDLCKIISSDYDLLSTNVLLFSSQKKKRILAEIDILALKDNKVDIYEVKCNSRRVIKAKKQLRRIKKLMPHVSNTYFFSGDLGEVKRLE